jgi:hypothetical protein
MQEDQYDSCVGTREATNQATQGIHKAAQDMNGVINCLGFGGTVICTDIKFSEKDDVQRLDVASAELDHIAHLMRIQGMAPSSFFSGILHVDGENRTLDGWMMARCGVPSKWMVPYTMTDVVMVKGSPEAVSALVVDLHKKS